MYKMYKAAATCVAVLLTGCSTLPPFKAYDGPQRPDSEHAFMTTDSDRTHKVLVGLDDRIFVKSVDGRSAQAPLMTTARSMYPDAVYLLPGKHEIELIWGNGFWVANGALSLDAQAGKQYIVRQYAEGTKVYLWAEDGMTGERVGSPAVRSDSKR